MKKSKKFVLAALALLAITGLLALAGCKNDTVPPEVEKQEQGDGGGSETDKNNTAAKLVSISVIPPTRTVYSVEQEFDSTGMKVTATYDDETTRPVTGTITTDTSTLTESAGVQTVTVSYKERETAKTTTFTVTVFPKEVKVLTGYTSPNHTGSEWTYVEFGEWPQTEAVDFKPKTAPQSHGIFDGNYYVEGNDKYVKEGDNYYKVEPIVWRVLTEDYKDPDGKSTGNALLLAESILTGGVRYYVSTDTREITKETGTEKVTVYPNNWQYSTVRAWLNGRYESDDPQAKEYAGKGFLQTAFTADAQKLIELTSVDNSAPSTNPASDPNLWNSGINLYASDTPTTDKVFLLSEKEATTESYGFAIYSDSGEDNTRIRVTTDYAKATKANQSSTPGYGGWWWLRSPNYIDERGTRGIDGNGYARNSSDVYFTYGDVVPALSISLQ